MGRWISLAVITLLVIGLTLTGCESAATRDEAEIRASVEADITEIMSDIDAATERDPSIGLSSNPYDYIGISPAFGRLVARGEQALNAIASEIESSPESGLREYLLAIAGQNIEGDDATSGSWSTGKEWAQSYRARE